MFNWRRLLVVTLIIQSTLLPRSISGILFQKKIAANSSDFATLFLPMVGVNLTLGSVIECGGFANTAIMNPNKTKRASAFYYNGGLCQLGRTTPIFNDLLAAKSTIIDGTPGVHVALDLKPMASVALADMWAYLVINELARFDDDPNLGSHNTANYDGVSMAFKFDMLSPVQTFEGQFAGTPIGCPIYLKYTITPKVFSALTFLVWFNMASGAQVPLITMTNGANFGTGINFWAYNSGGSLLFSIPNRKSIYVPGQVFPLNKWAYLGGSFDGINGIMTIYANGTLKNTDTTVGQYPLASVDTIWIGYYYDGNYDHYISPGSYIASVEIYERYMNTAAVQSAMAKSTTTRAQV